MKKIYMKPEVNVVKMMYTSQIMAGSLTGDYVKQGDAGTGENLSRGTDFWGDEDY